MKDKVFLGMLFDLYGNFLTKRQYDLLDLHVNHDLSLREISEQLQISRQGVFDAIQKGRCRLEECESRMGLHNQWIQKREVGKQALQALRSGDLVQVETLIRSMMEG